MNYARNINEGTPSGLNHGNKDPWQQANREAANQTNLKQLLWGMHFSNNTSLYATHGSFFFGGGGGLLSFGYTTTKVDLVASRCNLPTPTGNHPGALSMEHCAW